MNINKHSVKVLCFGDSNTWGYVPGRGERFPTDIKWTGLLQAALGDMFEIIEEGLNGRTTVIDDLKNEGKNGATYLRPCLQSHYPISIVILLLGTNDLKERFNRTPQQITEGIEVLLSIIFDPDSNYNHRPEVILMSPPIVDESIEEVKENYLGAEEKSRQLGALYKIIAAKHTLSFIDLSQVIHPSKTDGYHLDPASHKKVAQLLIEKIKRISINA